MTSIDIDTPHGRAVAHLRAAAEPAGLLMLGHGAGGGIGAPDLVAVSGVALELGVSVALVEQPYRVAGRRSPAPARQLDAAWIAVAQELLTGEREGLPLVAGGRSSGARVACRTAAQTGAAGVLCLAFPTQPPQRQGKDRAPDRLYELDAVELPLLIVQGEGDPFGMPPAAPGRDVVAVRGNHSLRSDMNAVAAAVARWLPGIVSGSGY